MCIILPVSHIPCTHTVSIWQHCIDATRSTTTGVKPCWNVQQRERAILTRSLCENCGGARFFARRGGVADRGDGSLPGNPDIGIEEEDEADDSGYHSDVIVEEEKEDFEELPVSPCATAPPRLRRKQRAGRRRRSSNHRPSSRVPSWTPNLKRELASLDPTRPSRARRDSIDSMMAKFDMDGSIAIAAIITDVAPTAQQLRRPTTIRKRGSTLLHPSSPPVEATATLQTAKAYPFPKVVHIRQPSEETIAKAKAAKKKNSTLLHPSSPEIEGEHASQQEEEQESPFHLPEAELDLPVQSRASIQRAFRSSPPQEKVTSRAPPSPYSEETSDSLSRSSTLLHPSPPATSLPLALPLSLPVPPHRSRTGLVTSSRHPPPLSKAPSAPILLRHVRAETAVASSRRASILHSSLSDSEDDFSAETDEGFFEPSLLLPKSGTQPTTPRFSPHFAPVTDLSLTFDAFTFEERKAFVPHPDAFNFGESRQSRRRYGVTTNIYSNARTARFNPVDREKLEETLLEESARAARETRTSRERTRPSREELRKREWDAEREVYREPQREHAGKEAKERKLSAPKSKVTGWHTYRRALHGFVAGGV